MTIYERSKYTQDVKQVRDLAMRLAWTPIHQLQDAARAITATEAPEITKAIFPSPPESDTMDTLLRAIEALKQDNEQYTKPKYTDVPGEYVSQQLDPDRPTIVYIHGGGFIYGSTGTARRTTKRLAEQNNASVIAISYRAATEQPFPGALLDILCAYMFLLKPPKGSSIIAIPCNRLILAGESSGLNLVMALTLVLLYLQQESPIIRFHGQNVKIELPVGIIGLSGFFDITCGLKSWSRYAGCDTLPQHSPIYSSKWKDEKEWPSQPPRADVYCERSAMTHQLVSPVTAPSWVGAPPLFIACGREEMCFDSNLYLAKQAALQGVKVRFKIYEMMTHAWPTTLPKLPHSAHVLESMACFVGDLIQRNPIFTRADIISFETLESRPCNIFGCSALRREQVLQMTAAARDARRTARRKITAMF